MTGLTDGQQAVLTLISSILIVVGSTTIPLGIEPKIGFGLAIIGAIGFGIKEYLGLGGQKKK